MRFTITADPVNAQSQLQCGECNFCLTFHGGVDVWVLLRHAADAHGGTRDDGVVVVAEFQQPRMWIVETVPKAA